MEQEGDVDLEHISSHLAGRPDLIKELLSGLAVERLQELGSLFTSLQSSQDKEVKSSLLNPDPEIRSKQLLEFILDISNELDVNCLAHKIVGNVGRISSADRCSLYLVGDTPENRLEEPQLVAAVNITGQTRNTHTYSQNEMEDSGHCTSLLASVVASGVPISIQDVDAAEVYGGDAKSLVCFPIRKHKGDVVAVLELVIIEAGKEFSPQELQMVERYLTFCGVAIDNCQNFTNSLLEYKKNQLLLGLAKSLFQEQMSLDRLITMIIREAKEMLKCERCTVFLLDLKMYDQTEIEEWLPREGVRPPSPAQLTLSLPKVVSTDTANEECQSLGSVVKEENMKFSVVYEMADMENAARVFPCNRLEESKRLELAKHVAANSEVLNLASVADWCGEELTEPDGLQPRTMLSLPIYNGQRTVIGVAQLINKLNGLPFDDKDISLFEAFAIFCGIGIHNTKMYESAYKLMAKQRVALDCLSYHATANDEDAIWLSKETIPQAEEFRLYSFKFLDHQFTDSTTVKIVLRMFLDFDLVSRFKIPYQVLCRWALSVKKNYRPVKYHNWRHALNVCQTMFTMLRTGKMERFMVDLEVLGLLVACLCHDLDHRGTNNAYQTKVTSPLAVLYSTSTMEHHHFDQCVMILSSDGNNIFQGLSTDEYKQVMQVVEMAILATDLASYFDKRQKFLSIADAGEIDWQDQEKKKLLCGMLMTASDVASIAKPWEVQHRLAKLVADEFFDQGDMEKLQLNITPIAMMDRERKDELPQMQVEFIDSVCVPLYSILSESFPWIRPLLDGALSNREKWIDLAEKVEMGLTWIDHDTIEQPVEEVEVGTAEAQDLELTVETLRCRQDAEKSSLVKKRSFRSLKSPVRPPVGFFNRKLSTRVTRGSNSDAGDNSSNSETSSLSTSRAESGKMSNQSPERDEANSGSSSSLASQLIVISRAEEF